LLSILEFSKLPAPEGAIVCARRDQNDDPGGRVMTLEALGSLGEIIGGLAVVVSLVYLAIQMKHNTMSVRSATYQSIVSTAAACNVTLTQSKDLARLFRIGSDDPDLLDEDEQVQFWFLCSQFLDIFENLYLQHRHGTIDDDYWLPRSTSYLELFKSPGFARNWAERRFDYATSFREHVDAELESGRHDMTTRRMLKKSESVTS
jgi:hypothetical protein